MMSGQYQRLITDFATERHTMGKGCQGEMWFYLFECSFPYLLVYLVFSAWQSHVLCYSDFRLSAPLSHTYLLKLLSTNCLYYIALFALNLSLKLFDCLLKYDDPRKLQDPNEYINLPDAAMESQTGGSSSNLHSPTFKRSDREAVYISTKLCSTKFTQNG